MVVLWELLVRVVHGGYDPSQEKLVEYFHEIVICQDQEEISQTKCEEIENSLGQARVFQETSSDREVLGILAEVVELAQINQMEYRRMSLYQQKK